MAKHQSEMRRQRDEFHSALRSIIRAFNQDLSPGGWMRRLTVEIKAAEAILQRCQTECGNIALFADRNQMDLQDRKDVP